MKLLCEDLLFEYGFFENKEKSNYLIKIFERDKLEINRKQDGNYYYTNTGIDYPIRDLTSLRRLYKEVKTKELNPF